MDLDESEVSRLLRGDVPADDPVWGDVSRFLDTVGTAYPIVSTTVFEGRHLAAVARESRQGHSELQHSRQGAVKRLFQGTHKVIAGSVGAFLIVMTAGVGVASAFGLNPLGGLLAPPPAASSVVPPAPSPKTASSDPADGNKDREQGTVSPRAVPSSIPTTSDPPTSPTASASESEKAAAKASIKAEKDAAKQAAKAKKAAEKAAEKARKDAEKAAKEAGKNTGKPTPTPAPGKGKGHG